MYFLPFRSSFEKESLSQAANDHLMYTMKLKQTIDRKEA